jgi:hypothetical protein
MPVDPAARKPGEDWIALVRKSGTPEFAAAFAANPVLHASVLSGPCLSIEAVAVAIGAGTGGMFDELVFTHETVDGSKTYLEWEGEAFGKPVGGSTILTRNAAGQIQSIQIHHRPFPMVLKFSAELENRLKGRESSPRACSRNKSGGASDVNALALSAAGESRIGHIDEARSGAGLANRSHRERPTSPTRA